MTKLFNKKKTLLQKLLIGFIILLTFSCDQLSKSVVRKNILEGERIEIINDNVILTKVENTGAFLSLGSDFPHFARNILLLLMPTVILVVTLVIIFTNKNLDQSHLVGLCLIVGGGIGNIYDRIVHGSVTDFMHIDFILFRTGIFNLADVFIMTGLAIIVIQYLLRKRKILADQ